MPVSVPPTSSPAASSSVADVHDLDGPPVSLATHFQTWGLSALFHLSLFLLLALTWKTVVQPAGEEPELLRVVELVAKRDTPEGPVYVEKTSDTATSSQPSEAGSPGPADIGQLLGGAASPVDLASALPKASEAAGAGLSTGQPLLGGGGLLNGPGAKTMPSAGMGRTKVYGLQGEGFKFVYVFDRSGSMGGSGNKALNSAKRELLRSLADLTDLHQFQIIFYNEEPSIMRLSGIANLMFATPQNKREAESFVAGISADGATQHEPALLAALSLAPDVVFFLTDADQPELTPAQLQRIVRLNGGRAVINTIEFGLGPKIRKYNFLDKLAEDNGGKSVYVDISGQ